MKVTSRARSDGLKSPDRITINPNAHVHIWTAIGTNLGYKVSRRLALGYVLQPPRQKAPGTFLFW